MPDQEPNEERLRNLLEAGADIAGGTAGALIGLGIGGPAGAVVGAGSGPAIAHIALHVGSEIKQRFLGPQEEKRIGATFNFIGQKIQENRENGEELRQDGFFEEQPDDRAAAEEIFEAVLLAAQREPQEKKLRFYGNLVANIAFDSTVSREEANLMINLAEGLSYRQLCILALLGERQILAEMDSPPIEDLFLPELREGAYRGRPPTPNEIAVALEAWDLQVRGLTHVGPTAMDHTWVNPAEMTLRDMGVSLYTLMELWDVDREDIEEIAELL